MVVLENKYITFKDGFNTWGVMFHPSLSHDDMGDKLTNKDRSQIIGAGYVRVKCHDGTIDYLTYGGSITLDITPHPDDAIILRSCYQAETCY